MYIIMVMPLLTYQWTRGFPLRDAIVIGCLSLIIAAMAQMVYFNNRGHSAASAVIEEQQFVYENKLQTTSADLAKLQFELEATAEAYQAVATDGAKLAWESWVNHRDLYLGLDEKVAEYEKQGVKVTTVKVKLAEIEDWLVANELDKVAEAVTEETKALDTLLAEKKKADAAKVVAQTSLPVGSAPNGGYSRIAVQTSRGTFTTDVVNLDLGSVQVVTVTGNDGNCDNDCVTKPLATYISEQSGFAGINGTYFCPPDYASCGGKVNSYDFPVYSSQHGKWINADKLFWNDRAMMAFKGSDVRFCQSANGCDSGGVTAGIVNYPALVDGGVVVVNEGALAENLRTVKGVRGAIGVSGSKLYLVVVRSASVPDAAHVLQALGVQKGMNLDGGGSTALYYNGYKAGPGRSLPNAVVVKSR